MTLIIRTICFSVLLLALPVTGAFGASGLYASADDEGTIMAARAAVAKLGAAKGAIGINQKSVDIVGLPAASIMAKSVSVEAALRDLQAKKVGTEIRISLSGDVLFAFDKASIRPEAEGDLVKIAQVVKKLGKGRMIIEGYTDAKGSDDYNQKLSLQRANSVKEWFIKKAGLNQISFLTSGLGEAKPVAPNTRPDGTDNPEGRAKNRRVEIRLQE